MDLLIATWTLRIAIIAGLAIGGASYSAGTPVIECVDRAMAAAVGFTLLGRWLVGWIEPPELRMLRKRRRRELARAKKSRSKAGANANARAGARGSGTRSSTVSRTA